MKSKIVSRRTNKEHSRDIAMIQAHCRQGVRLESGLHCEGAPSNWRRSRGEKAEWETGSAR
ncbi:hypothetical protein IAE29_14615 [Ochrobactrum sp. S46]|nr:hypothetical protein [Ochrobactrum sp. S45]MBK0044573.1 hypothetical protein [Ochrobactrum sp. S46]